MHPDLIERLERAAFEMVVQALEDYKDQAAGMFRMEVDKPQDIAEDIIREAMDAMGVPGFRERLYGKVDYKRAIYVFVPNPGPVALMLDAKAEKGNGSATIQMSQTSMIVRYVNSRNEAVEEPGKLAATIERTGRKLHVVSIIAKCEYREPSPGHYELDRFLVACIPNRKLQDQYNPTAQDTIWRAGRHSPKRDEEFRVRLSFGGLREKANWRVREVKP